LTNKELADHLRRLQAYLVIAGYDEVHARRYGHIAHEIESMGEPVQQIRREGRLREIPGVGPSIAGYIKEILDSGKCSKQEDWEKTVPLSVVELIDIPGLGVTTAQRLLHNYGVFSLQALVVAIDGGLLLESGFSNATLRSWRSAAVELIGPA